MVSSRSAEANPPPHSHVVLRAADESYARFLISCSGVECSNRSPSSTARLSRNLHSAIDDDIDSGDVRTVIGGQEQSDVRRFFRPADPRASYRACSSPILGPSAVRRDWFVSITPCEIELARIPCSRHADDASLGRGVRESVHILKAYQRGQRGVVHDYPVASLQITPRSAHE